MNIYEVAKKTLADGMQLIRVRKGTINELDCKDWNGGNKRGWIYLDAFTSSAIVQVYEALSPENQAKLLDRSPTQAINLVWKLIKK